MEFGQRQLTCAMGLFATIFALGCAESSAYIEYSQLPQSATESSPDVKSASDTPASQDNNGALADTAAASSDDEVAKPDAVGQQDDATEPALSAVTDDPMLKPVTAVYADTAPGKVSQVVNEITTDSKDATEPTELDVPRKIELLVPQNSFAAIKDTDAVRVSYDDIDLIKILNMDPVPVNAVDYFPDWLQQLDGQRIRIKGYMYPTFKSEGLKGFVLTRDTGECCFGPNAFVYFLIKVRLAEGQKTDYIHNKPFDVEGVFRIDPEADDSGLFQLYRIEDAKML